MGVIRLAFAPGLPVLVPVFAGVLGCLWGTLVKCPSMRVAAAAFFPILVFVMVEVGD